MIFKATRGQLWHVVHETRTANFKDVTYVLCRSEYLGAGMRKRGSVTSTSAACSVCLKIDNPMTLSTAARAALEESATVRPDGLGLRNSRGYRELQTADLVDGDEELTARGRVLAQDFTEGPSPMPDEHGVVHKRDPFQYKARCDGTPLQPFRGVVTLDTYVKLRQVYAGTVVTCVACLSLNP
jgi:hypothetical protein